MALTWTPLANLPDGGYWGEGGIAGVGTQLWMSSFRLDNYNPIAIYDIPTDTWEIFSPDISGLSSGMRDTGIVADGTTLWFYGGYTPRFVSFDTISRTFDVEYIVDGSLDWSHQYRTAMVLIGRTIYIYGDWDNARFLTFNIDTHEFNVTSESTHDTSYRGICTDGEIIYCVEGYRGGWSDVGIDPVGQYDTGVIEFYNIATDSWSYSTHTDPHYRDDNAAVFADKVYAVGGGSDDRLAPSGRYCVEWVSSYDPSTDMWTVETDLDQPRGEPQVIYYLGRLYVIGGYGDNLDPSTSMVFADIGGGGGGGGAVTLPFYDDFNRDDAPTLGGHWRGSGFRVQGQQAVAGTTAVAFQDDFNRPDADGLGAGYEFVGLEGQTSVWQVATGCAIPVQGSYGVALWDPGGTAYTSTVTLGGSFSLNTGLVAHFIDENNYVALQNNYVYAMVAGVSSSGDLGLGETVLATGDQISLRVSSTEIEATVNGLSWGVFAMPEALAAASKTGLLGNGYFDETHAPTFDDFAITPTTPSAVLAYVETHTSDVVVSVLFGSA